MLKTALSVLFFMLFTALYAQIPAGYYYHAMGTTGADLKTKLSEISYPQKVLSYGGGESGYTWEGFSKTDKNEDGSVIDMYSDVIRYFDGINAVSGMHIEHSLPKSWWGSHVNYAYKDLFHLYPSDGITNSTKNDLPLGEISLIVNFDNGVSKTGQNIFGNSYSGNCFEPSDEYKGDFARSYLYISTIYEGFDHLWKSPMMDNNRYPVWKPWAIDLLLKWNKQDPVSEKERKRNEVIFGIQGNRNPYIDYPELAEYIWGENKNSQYPFPEETKPFLISPRIGYAIDFGVIMQNNVKTESIDLQGVNVIDDIKIALKGDSVFALTKNVIDKEEAITGTSFRISFTPKYSGKAYDTIVISGGELTVLEIPVSALASAEFLSIEPIEITPVGGKLQWINDAAATDYLLSVYQGDTESGDLIISSYLEGSSYNKAIEIYNGTGKSVNLENYSLRKQSNGIGNFTSNFKLNGTLGNNETYIILHKMCNNNNLMGIADVYADSVLSFNGNDAIALYRNGIKIDVVGFENDGGENMWGENKTLHRKKTVTHPRGHYNVNEWDSYEIDYFDKLRTHYIEFSDEKNTIVEKRLLGNVSEYIIEELNPEQSYTYYIESVIDNVACKTLNTAQIHTSKLETPVIMEPTDITASSFNANWEETPYADGYLIDMFYVKNAGETVDTVDFNNIGSSGKPLPNGWSGTASGNYTTTASSGMSPNSIALKNSGEYIKSETYTSPITKIKFMYRFPSSGVGNILTVDVLKNDMWENVDSIIYKNTSKNYPVYSFDSDDNVKAVKFTFLKKSGNLAIDDIIITYGKTDYVYIGQDMPIKDNLYSFNNLESDKEFFYRVKATLANSTSDPSDVMSAKTLISTFINNNIEENKIIWKNHKSGLMIYGVEDGDVISIYDIMGSIIYKRHVSGSEIFIPLTTKGIYLIHKTGKKDSILKITK